MERTNANDNDATTSETDEQKKPRARARPIVLPINAAVEVPEYLDTTVPQQPRKKHKTCRKPPPIETMENPFEESKAPTPMGAIVHDSRILPDMRHLNDSTPTLRHQMRFSDFPSPASTNVTVPGSGGRLPASNILPRFRPMDYNEAGYSRNLPRTETESVSALVASLPTASSLPFQYSSLSASRPPEALYSRNPPRIETESVSALVASLPTTSSSLPFQYGSISASRPPEALNYWPRTASVLSQGAILPNLVAPQLTQTTHMSETWRSPVASSVSGIANSFGLQDARLALAASQSMAFWNSNNSIGAPLSSQLHRSANHILEDMLRGQQEPLPQNLVVDAALAMRNVVGAASMEQQRPAASMARPTTGLRLPAILGQSRDSLVMNEHQAYLRQQIEVFEATQDDIYANTRGRNRRIHIGQVGVRCRHCAHIPPRQRQSSTVYFPATMRGLYQAAQNMSTNHIQCGLCTEMPESVKARFIELWPTKNNVSSAGRRYWEENARRLGLVDTDNGIAFHPNAGR